MACSSETRDTKTAMRERVKVWLAGEEVQPGESIDLCFSLGSHLSPFFRQCLCEIGSSLFSGGGVTRRRAGGGGIVNQDIQYMGITTPSVDTVS
jgi:hypothetical protein